MAVPQGKVPRWQGQLGADGPISSSLENSQLQGLEKKRVIVQGQTLDCHFNECDSA